IEQPREQMTERAEAAQDRCHQPSHQRAVTVGKRLETWRGAGTVELIVERAMLVQHAVQDVGSDTTRRETRHLGSTDSSLGGHARTSPGGERQFREHRGHADTTSPLPREYAKCKNWLWHFQRG